jgi:hypothetical protein
MGVLNKIRNALVSFDFYSTGVSMTFKKSTTFKTLYGGLFSICLLAFMVFVCFIDLRKMINKEIKSTMISRTYENVFNSTKEYEFMKNGPNFMFEYYAQHIPYMADSGELPSFLFFFKLFKLSKISTEPGDGRMEYEDLPNTKWDVDSILSKFGKKISTNSHTYCFVNDNVTTHGSRGTDNSKVFAVFAKCDSRYEQWVKDEQKSFYLIDGEFRLNVVNKYYDFSDIKSPLKEYVLDTEYLSLDLNYYKKMQVFIRENRVVQYDSIWPWADPEEYIFYSVSDTKINFSNSTEDDSMILGEFEIAMDNQIGKFQHVNLHRHLREEIIHNARCIEWHWRDFWDVTRHRNYSGGHFQ